MPRAPLIVLVTSLALALGCGGADDRPNLLLVTIDTLRADALACYGGEADVGVEICALADAGTRHAWAFSTAPFTAPSVTSILTSRYPLEHGVTQNARSFLRTDAVTLAEVLRAAGYRTAAFVSNPVLDRAKRLDQGFDHWDQEMHRQEFNRRNYVERHAIDTTDAVLAWMKEDGREPWFVWVHYQDPHGPYAPPGAPTGRNRPGSVDLPILENDSGRGGIPAYQAMPGVTSLATYAHRYRGEIRVLDREVGRLIREIDGRGRAPAVLLTADHGEAFGEDGYYLAHGHSVGLDQIRVPLLWRPPPGQPTEAAVATTSVSGIDVAPTLLRAAGVVVPDAFRGRPLQDRDADASPPRPIFAEGSRQAAVIEGADYYSRERNPGLALRENGKPWGDDNADLPPRMATLGDADALPPYAPVPEAPPPALESALLRHLGSARRDAGGRHDRVSPEMVERLRALGYANDE